MLDRDRENQEEALEAFRENFDAGLDELLDNAEIFLDVPRPPDPNSMGFDDRTLEELNTEELEVVRQTLYKKLEIDPGDPQRFKIRDYQTKTIAPLKRPSGIVIPPESTINVSVYRTNREEVFLQELTFPDNDIRWALGPDQDI